MALMGDSLRTQLLKFVAIVAVLLLIVGGVLRWLYVDVVTVGNDAMAPTFFAGDTILVWRTSDFDHGDVMLCRHPRTQGAWVMGRMVGRPGMSVSFEREQLTINRQRVNRDFQGEFQFEDQNSHAQVRFVWGREELGEVDHLFMERPERTIAMRAITDASGYFLLNDNRTWVGDDSRTFGPVQQADCTGVVFMRWSPGGRAPAALGQGNLDILD
jgi:signal peptidase I